MRALIAFLIVTPSISFALSAASPAPAYAAPDPPDPAAVCSTFKVLWAKKTSRGKYDFNTPKSKDVPRVCWDNPNPTANDLKATCKSLHDKYGGGGLTGGVHRWKARWDQGWRDRGDTKTLDRANISCDRILKIDSSLAGSTTNRCGGNVCTENLQALSNGLAFFALTASVIGICVSAGLWAMGSKGQNPGQELTGKRGFIVCCTAAFFVGALSGIISWAQGQAQTVDSNHILSK